LTGSSPRQYEYKPRIEIYAAILVVNVALLDLFCIKLKSAAKNFLWVRAEQTRTSKKT
jgi:hypothetical protein